MVVNMHAGAYSTISVQACDHSTPAAPELDQGSCMHTVQKATNLISPYDTCSSILTSSWEMSTEPATCHPATPSIVMQAGVHL